MRVVHMRYVSYEGGSCRYVSCEAVLLCSMKVVIGKHAYKHHN